MWEVCKLGGADSGAGLQEPGAGSWIRKCEICRGWRSAQHAPAPVILVLKLLLMLELDSSQMQPTQCGAIRRLQFHRARSATVKGLGNKGVRRLSVDVPVHV